MKQMKKLLAVLLSLALLWTLLPPAYAEETSGQLKNSDVYWKLSEDESVLTIWGSGKMMSDNYYQTSTAPWHLFRFTVKKIVVQEGVTSVGRRAFLQMHEVTEISLPESVTAIE